MSTPIARFGQFLLAFADTWFTKMSGPLTVPFAIAAAFVSHPWLKLSLGSLALLCGVSSSYAVWRKERESRIAEVETLKEALMVERQKNERPELLGGIIGVSKSPLSLLNTRCRIQIDAWIRNDRRVETGVRLAAIVLRNTQGKELFIPTLSVQQPTTNLEVKLQTERLGYGRRIEGFWAFEVDTSMENVDGASAEVTILDDFDQRTLLRH